MQRMRYRLAEERDAEEERVREGRAKRRKKSQGEEEEDYDPPPPLCESSDDEGEGVRKKPATEIPEEAQEEYRKMIMEKFLSNKVSGWQMKQEVRISQRAGARGWPLKKKREALKKPMKINKYNKQEVLKTWQGRPS